MALISKKAERLVYTLEDSNNILRRIEIGRYKGELGNTRNYPLRDFLIKKQIVKPSNPVQKLYLNAKKLNHKKFLKKSICYPDAKSEEEQVVVPVKKPEKVLREHHVVSPARRYGIAGIYHRIAKRYFWFVWECRTQQACYLLDIKNIKPRLAILKDNDHSMRYERLPTIKFALSTGKWNHLNK
ncbi:hypothetical protein CEXT_753751 [Caerostris extrusa]|uniref:Uncharacterized protein n=1 Tax=Caerostris extrusa TaxID=172846 RepID=A0AAV4YER5_CAEEX|nr:hypothetical protein CEXT_753751 [Caerostris extrusa]